MKAGRGLVLTVAAAVIGALVAPAANAVTPTVELVPVNDVQVLSGRELSVTSVEVA